jgi:hypothetical protein
LRLFCVRFAYTRAEHKNNPAIQKNQIAGKIYGGSVAMQLRRPKDVRRTRPVLEKFGAQIVRTHPLGRD